MTRKKKSARATTGGHLDRERITMQEAARYLGLTERRLRQLIKEGNDIPVVGKGRQLRFRWPDLREWRDNQLIDQGVRSVRPQSVEEARARVLTADADLKEMEVAQRRGTLMPAGLYHQELESAYLRVKAHALNAPERYGPQFLSKLSDALRADHLVRVVELIRGMMNDHMAELAAGDDVPDDEELAAG